MVDQAIHIKKSITLGYSMARDYRHAKVTEAVTLPEFPLSLNLGVGT